jgi:hypothetical protein
MTIRRKSPKRQASFAAGVGRGMRRAARTAREVARIVHIDNIEVPRSTLGKRLKTKVNKVGIGSASIELGDEEERERRRRSN